MMDVTPLFKACVKTVKTRNKALGTISENDRNSILSSSKMKTEFTLKAKEVAKNISKLKDFLLQHRKDYISVGLVPRATCSMTDMDRDQIDNDAQSFMKACSEAIKSFRTETFRKHTPPQVTKHREEVLLLLEEYLKVVCKIYSEQRAIRVKKVVDTKRLSRLQPETYKQASVPTKPTSASGLLTLEERDAGVQNQKKPKTSAEPSDASSVTDETDDDHLSPEDAQLFEEENQQLYDEMNCMVDEVRQIEGKVVEISRLQEIFMDKVLEQEADINHISEKAVTTTENVKDANEQIREAIKNNAGFRVWILFFLTVLSFSLLFLDWYNP